MFNFFDSLCGCFSPELKRNIIEYLSSAKLNQQVIEEQKTTEESQPPQQSIYNQVKTKSYYFMKLEQEEHNNPKTLQKDNQLFDNSQQPNYYPSENNVNLDELYKLKLECLQKILRQQIGVEYSKIYDSQDETALKVYCKPQIYQNKRFNSYRFTFQIPIKEHSISPKGYLELKLQAENFNLHQPLLLAKQRVSVTENKLEVFHRKYKKILVINQHEFYTAEKAVLIQEEGSEVVYNTVFSVKGQWIKLTGCSRGWVNLAGLRILHEKKQDQGSNSLQESEGSLIIEGYINTELQISVNANMLKQPIAKQIRVYVQKLICSLTKSDGI